MYTPSPSYAVQVFFDSDCPICSKEIRMLEWLDRRDRIRFTDIAAPGFSAADHGTDMDTLMARLRGRRPDGSWIDGVETMRALYTAVGFGWVAALTRLPGLSHLSEWGYEVFARNRLKWTGRCDDACELPASDASESAIL